ncbi:hypothetical protein CJJ23_02600 [Mycoplasmopsis agassizii]|uniref:Uncharacterized protein n=1 Tax=Mycoplasmopsis agassizii TaxID=33922 RepID=A0A269TIJ6_9BACT|nr:hypothetical protein CJJ23_02600 [Mycoplasmopsis agassizii]
MVHIKPNKEKNKINKSVTVNFRFQDDIENNSCLYHTLLPLSLFKICLFMLLMIAIFKKI